MSEMGEDLSLDDAGLHRIRRVADNGGIVSSHWVIELVAEIRRLRAENDDLKHLVHQAIPGQFDVCGNSYVNAWLEKWLRLAQAVGVYKGPLIGVCNDPRASWMESQGNQT
ncbi:MAG: hypothetical protein ACR2P3_14880 [Geminicoccaceae bacterium]